jgi:hypothetical protein
VADLATRHTFMLALDTFASLTEQSTRIMAKVAQCAVNAAKGSCQARNRIPGSTRLDRKERTVFKVEFKTEGEAFSGSNRANGGEIAFIMQKLIIAVTMGQTDGAIRDSNGNTIGQWSWQKGSDDGI